MVSSAGPFSTRAMDMIKRKKERAKCKGKRDDLFTCADRSVDKR